MSTLEHEVTLVGSRGRARCRARFSDEFIVFEDCSEEVIIGAKTMQAWHITLDFGAEQVTYRKTARRLRV